MTVQFRNREDTRRYAAAEDAYTSEGGFLALEDDAPEKEADADRNLRHPSRDFKKMANRYAAGMHAAMAVFHRETPRQAARAAHPPA